MPSHHHHHSPLLSPLHHLLPFTLTLLLLLLTTTPLTTATPIDALVATTTKKTTSTTPTPTTTKHTSTTTTSYSINSLGLPIATNPTGGPVIVIVDGPPGPIRGGRVKKERGVEERGLPQFAESAPQSPNVNLVFEREPEAGAEAGKGKEKRGGDGFVQVIKKLVEIQFTDNSGENAHVLPQGWGMNFLKGRREVGKRDVLEKRTTTAKTTTTPTKTTATPLPTISFADLPTGTAGCVNLRGGCLHLG